MAIPAVTDPLLTAALSPDETACLRDAASELCGRGAAGLDSPRFLAAARDACEDLPRGLRRLIRSFRRDPGAGGALLLHGLPVTGPDLPQTPMVYGSVQREAIVPAAALMLVAMGLGEPVAFASEKSGALVQDVVPVPDMQNSQSNAGSDELEFHTENAFHPHRPDFVLLLCLRPDPSGAAALRVASARRVLPRLDPGDFDVLRRPYFITEAPPSFGGQRPLTEPHSVLNGDPADPDLRVDLAATRPISPQAAAALGRLGGVLRRAALDMRLEAGDLAIVDNRVAVHGRSTFRPRFDGQDRWLQRVFVHADLRRSRAARPTDTPIVVN